MSTENHENSDRCQLNNETISFEINEQSMFYMLTNSIATNNFVVEINRTDLDRTITIFEMNCAHPTMATRIIIVFLLDQQATVLTACCE
jgi:hypothetical protein